MASPSAPPPSASARSPEARPPRAPRKPIWPRTATLSTLRLGVLIGGLVIIADLLTQLIIQRTTNADDALAVLQVDQIANVLLYVLLGILMVRDTDLMYAGAVAGLVAGLLDAVVVTAAALLVPHPPPSPDPQELSEQMILVLGAAQNIAQGVIFAGASGVIYTLVQRLPGGRRPR